MFCAGIHTLSEWVLAQKAVVSISKGAETNRRELRRKSSWCVFTTSEVHSNYKKESIGDHQIPTTARTLNKNELCLWLFTHLCFVHSINSIIYVVILPIIKHLKEGERQTEKKKKTLLRLKRVWPCPNFLFLKVKIRTSSYFGIGYI